MIDAFTCTVILREQLDGAVGQATWDTALQDRGTAFWEDDRAKVEQAARATDPQV